MRFKTIHIIVILFFTLINAANSQDEVPLIEVTSEVDTSLITIGDRINYTISIEHAQGLRVEQPGAGVNLGQFEIKQYDIQPPLEQDGRVLLKYSYEISVYDTGKFTIPPFPVAYFPTDSLQDYRIIEASPINIYVESLLQDESKELKDVKPPIYLPYDYVLLATIIIAGILILAAVYLAYRFYRNKKETGYLIKPPEPPRPAHEIALAELETLLAQQLPQQGKIKQYYSELSEIIRRYIEGRYFIPALEETSFEIISEMRSQQLNADLFQLLQEFLSLSDLVKFAKHVPDEGSHGTSAENARKFINQTKIELESAFTEPENPDEKEKAEVA